MNKIIFKFRIKLANLLIHLAKIIRPKTASEFMKYLQDSIMYGRGYTRVDPKEMFKDENDI